MLVIGRRRTALSVSWGPFGPFSPFLIYFRATLLRFREKKSYKYKEAVNTPRNTRTLYTITEHDLNDHSQPMEPPYEGAS
jgi:hypothetical protein